MSDLPAPFDPHLARLRGGQYITFHVGEELFGVNILCVEEIITPRAYTTIPRTPKYFLGIINLRGEVISIIDLRKRFKVQPKGPDTQNRIVVIELKGMKLGMMVDSISSIVRVEEAQIQHTTRIMATGTQQYIGGTYKLDEKQILLLLDQHKLVQEEDFIVPVQYTPGAGGEVTRSAAQEKEAGGAEVFLVGFSIGNERFALSSLSVEEIIVMPQITPIPEMSDFVEGIFHLRESAIPVLRLGKKLAVKGQEDLQKCPVIIINVFDVKVGLIVDQITEVYLIKEKEIVDPPITLNPGQMEQLRGVIKQERAGKQQIVMLLAMEKLFTEEEQEKLKEIDLQNEAIANLEDEREDEVPILEFLLNGEKYAIPVFLANEIIPVRPIVPVPKSPPYVMGVINLRGDVISIVNLPLLVGNKKYEFSIHTRILIVHPGHDVAGLIVEKVIGIRKVLMTTFKKPSDLLTRRGNVFILGMSKDEKTDNIVVLMDLVKTLAQSQEQEPDQISEEGILSLQEELRLLDAEEDAILEGRK